MLDASGRPYTLLHHAAARTAEEAAAARGTPLSMGGKTVLMTVERLGPVLVVVGSDRRIDGKRLRKGLGVQRYRFATDDELLATTGLRSGEVPAFGRPCFDALLVVGEDLLEREELVFAAASAAASVCMRTADWRAVAAPRVLPSFTE